MNQKNETVLAAEYLKYKPEIDAAIGRVLASGRYILGKEVERFEERFAELVGANYAVGVASGADALLLSFLLHGGKKVLLRNEPLHASVFNAIRLAGCSIVEHDAEVAFSTYKDTFIEAHIIDACQSSFKRLPVGAWFFACYSFHPLKPLHCYGDGGAVCVQDRLMYTRLREMRRHCPLNSRLDEIQAAVLNVMLDYRGEIRDGDVTFKEDV